MSLIKYVVVGLVMVCSMGATPGTTHLEAVAGSLQPPKLAAIQPTQPLIEEHRVGSVSVQAPVKSDLTASFAGLLGSLGYSRAGGNCVNEPGVNNPHNGNPISWPVLTRTPHIGATVLFIWNHTGVVTGIWSNGDIEVRHQNCGGCPHRYPPSMIRGYR